ncbi:DUF402 domain-containing protein [Microbispora triticiradicis]|uniref:DUF402 domain-containing protein n=1 Tax=Microbispora triticiradicis TaxID=2200763 RepID=UPI001AD76695|nr:DUF402 domain-containing protein [Microbispora triticiradicis]MBO4269615.1 DUF402 domain-containing protein [Microbispora triticiradicis]
MSEVRIVYRKYGGALHWHHFARLLGEDEHGVWAGFPARTVAQRGHEPETVFEVPSVMLFPRDSWWTASFNAPPHKAEIYCDITTVPVRRDGRITMADLDLDVLRMRDGRVLLDDEDEFAEHQVRYAYPQEIISQAERSAAWLMEAVTARTGPFGGAHDRWLSLVS